MFGVGRKEGPIRDRQARAPSSDTSYITHITIRCGCATHPHTSQWPRKTIRMRTYTWDHPGQFYGHYIVHTRPPPPRLLLPPGAGWRSGNKLQFIVFVSVHACVCTQLLSAARQPARNPGRTICNILWVLVCGALRRGCNVVYMYII